LQKVFRAYESYQLYRLEKVRYLRCRGLTGIIEDFSILSKADSAAESQAEKDDGEAYSI
jgi:hypothetical protein